MQLAPRPRTIGIPDCGGPRLASRLRLCLTTGLVVIEVTAVAAMQVASGPAEIQARPVQLAAASDTVTEMSSGLEIDQILGEIVSTRGSLGVVGQVLPAGSLVGRGGFSAYVRPYGEASPITFDDQKSLSQGVLHDLVPSATPTMVNHFGGPRMAHNAQGAQADVADGMVDVLSARSTAFADLSSTATAAAIGEVQTMLLSLLVNLNLKLVLLQATLLNLLVILIGT